MDSMTGKHIALATGGIVVGGALGASIMHEAMLTPAQREGKFPAWAIVLLILAGLGLLAGGAYLLMQRKPTLSYDRRREFAGG